MRRPASLPWCSPGAPRCGWRSSVSRSSSPISVHAGPRTSVRNTPSRRRKGLTRRLRRAIDPARGWCQRPGARAGFFRGITGMPIRLDTSAPDFAARFKGFLAVKREASADVEAAVRAIIDDVIARGDAALIELTRRFDRIALAPADLKVGAAEIEQATAQCDPDALAALEFA